MKTISTWRNFTFGGKQDPRGVASVGSFGFLLSPSLCVGSGNNFGAVTN